LKESPVPKVKIPTVETPVEYPVANAVYYLQAEKPMSSGFMEKHVPPRWTIVFWGKISDKAVKAAESAGLKVRYREMLPGSGQYFTDVYSELTQAEWEKAKLAFDEFASSYSGLPKYSFIIGAPPSASYLKVEEECQIISPQYYDILTWLNVPVPDYSFAIEPEAKERKIDEVLEKLKDGVSRITDSAFFREFLITMAKFHQYSIGNQILIMLQRKDATRVAGIKTWNELGRYVKRGEHGIAILAPCLPPKELKRWILWDVQMKSSLGVFNSPEEAEEYADKHLVKDWRKNVEIRKEEAAPVPTYFKVVYVFDVSQTEGKPLPEIVVPTLSGAYSQELYNKLMKLATKQSLTVSFEPRPELGPEIKGTLLGKTIWVKPDEPEAQKLKTLAHEEAHYFTEAVYFIPRAEAEVIAESVAFVVGAHFGFDTGVRSFPYVAIWAREKKVLEQNLSSIRRISGRMIEELMV
jgi:hypothetical protein